VVLQPAGHLPHSTEFDSSPGAELLKEGLLILIG
jgi:hypothetical protein